MSKKGIENIGNTCYMNAALQMLIQNKDFCKIILNADADNINKDKKNVNAMAKLINDYYDSKTDVLNPTYLKTCFVENNKTFNNREQHDAQEFILSLIDILDSEISREKNKNNQLGKLKEIFKLEISTKIKCKRNIDLESNLQKELTSLLSIPVEGTTLNDCYRKFKAYEIKDDYECERCINNGYITKGTKGKASFRPIVKLPNEHLIIQLKRFVQDENSKQMKKIEKSIDVPLNWRHGFKIKGAIIHKGKNLGGGHYIYISRDDNGKWTKYDDKIVSNIDNAKAQEDLNQAYILYYVR